MALWDILNKPLFGRANCPVDEEQRSWVHSRMEWLARQFGRETWLEAKAIEPTPEFFPDPYDRTESSVRCMLDRICCYMGIDSGRVSLELFDDKAAGAAGYYRKADKEIVSVEIGNLHDPVAVVGTIAHELAHARLLGEERISRDMEDHESLTDLTTVFFGLGIFNANSTVRFGQWSSGNRHGWQASSIGYLGEEMFGYALGHWTIGRGDEKPRWRKHLRTNVRHYMTESIKYRKVHPIPASPTSPTTEGGPTTMPSGDACSS